MRCRLHSPRLTRPVLDACVIALITCYLHGPRLRLLCVQVTLMKPTRLDGSRFGISVSLSPLFRSSDSRQKVLVKHFQESRSVMEENLEHAFFDTHSAYFNQRFVHEVEKHPELYDYTLKDYGIASVVEKAWCKVAVTLYLTVDECKVKWNDFLCAFISDANSSGSGRRNEKSYCYPIESMQFMLPLVKTSGISVEDVFDRFQRPALEPSLDSTGNVLDEAKEGEDFRSESQGSVGSLSAFSRVRTLTTSMRRVDFYRSETLDYARGLDSTPAGEKSRKRNGSDVGLPFEDDSNVEKIITAETVNERDPERRIFLLSLLPTIENLTDSQMDLFKFGTQRVIDAILNPIPYLQPYLPTNYLPAGFPVFDEHPSPFTGLYPPSVSFGHPQTSVAEHLYNRSLAFHYGLVRDISTNADGF